MESNEKESNEDQSKAAGLIEGYLTEDLIYTHSKNIYGEKQPSKHVGGRSGVVTGRFRAFLTRTRPGKRRSRRWATESTGSIASASTFRWTACTRAI